LYPVIINYEESSNDKINPDISWDLHGVHIQ
jgi:hypothetical protein